MMSRGRLMIEKRKDLASASKWEAQTQALLRDELGDHPYTKRFEVALSQPRPEGLVAADGVLWAAYEDALKGDLRPVVKEGGPAWPIHRRPLGSGRRPPAKPAGHTP